MGGNAIKKFFASLTGETPEEPVRLPREKYLKIEEEVIKLLSPYFKNWCIPGYYNEKKDFGDVDIVYVPTEDFDIAKIQEVLNSQAVVQNGTVHSLEYNMFQIDLIRVTEELLDVTSAFFSWSLFGKFISMICTVYGFKFGIQGLYMKVFDTDACKKNNFNNSYIGNIILSQNIREIFHFLGLNYHTFSKGFTEESELFEFIKTSRLFESWIFHTDKVKRNSTALKSRLAELDRFLSTFKITDPPSNEEIEILKQNLLKEALDYFKKNKDYDDMLANNEEKKRFKLKFNGNIVREVTKMQGKQLGEFVTYLRSGDEFMEFCRKSTPEEIIVKIKTEYTKYMEIIEKL